VEIIEEHHHRLRGPAAGQELEHALEQMALLESAGRVVQVLGGSALVKTDSKAVRAWSNFAGK
jgi:hypothetical protein